MEGNPYSYPCSTCNLQMFPKHRIPAYCYNLPHQAKFILRNISERDDNVGSIVLNNMVQILDLGNHFNKAGLHHLFQTVVEDELLYLKQFLNAQMQFSLMKRGLPYPSLVDEMPDLENFVDINYLSSFSESDLQHVVQAYDYFCQ